MSYKLKYIKYKTKCQAIIEKINKLIQNINDKKEDEEDYDSEDNLEENLNTNNKIQEEPEEIVMMVINDIITKIELQQNNLVIEL